MKFIVYEEKNLTFYVPVNKPFKLSKILKEKGKINYNYTKTKEYLANCLREKNIKHIIFIKHKDSRDIIYVFKSKEFFIKGGKNES